MGVNGRSKSKSNWLNPDMSGSQFVLRTNRRGVGCNEKAHFVTLSATVDPATLYVAKMQERDHLVVPVVALVEGVLYGQNSSGPELALAEVFGAHLEGWNGRPVVMNHPQLPNGDFVSANSPSIQDEWAFGQIFNSRLEDNKLKVEAWIDTARAAELGGDFEETLGRLQSAEMVEVSVGVFVVLEEAEGYYNGKEYGQVWVEIIPDHLAMLSNGVLGACSAEDGCGAPRVNALGNMMVENNTQLAGRGHSSAVRPVVSSQVPLKARRADPYARFKEPQQPSMQVAPVHTQEARSSCNCNCDDGGGTCNCKGNSHAAISPSSSSLSEGETQPHAESTSAEDMLSIGSDWARRIGATLSVNALPRERFSQDIYTAVARALRKKYEYSYCMGYTIDYAVFEQYVPDLGYRFFKVGIDVSENLEVTFTDEPLEVHLITSIIEVQETSEGDDGMTVASGGVPAEIGTAGTAGTTASPEIPDTTANEVSANETTDGATTVTAVNSQPQVAESAVAPASVTITDYIAAAPAEVREVLQQSVRMLAAQKNDLISSLLSTNRCNFSKEDLAAMSVDQLQNLAALADIPEVKPVADYSGQGAPRMNVVGGEESGIRAAPLVFETKQAG